MIDRSGEIVYSYYATDPGDAQAAYDMCQRDLDSLDKRAFYIKYCKN